MSVSTLQNQALARLKSFVKGVRSNRGSVQHNIDDTLKEPLTVDGVVMPIGTRYVVFRAPGKGKADKVLCAFFLADRQLTVKENSLTWLDYDRPIRRPSTALF